MGTSNLNEGLDKLEIGQKAFVIDLLNKYNLPYKKEDIKRIIDDKGITKAFEIILDKNVVIEDYKDEKIVPNFIKEGNIKITITY